MPDSIDTSAAIRSRRDWRSSPFPFPWKISNTSSSSLLVFFFFLSLVLIPSSLIFASREKERTLAIIKPDGLFGNHTDKIKRIIRQSGFTILKEMMIQLDEPNATLFYAEHSGRNFFPSLIEYMISGPVIVMVLEKENAVADWRAFIGPTDAREAKFSHPGSIRAMCGSNLERNCVHGSDSTKSAAREISFFFPERSPGWCFLSRGHGVPVSVEERYQAISNEFRRFEELDRGGSGSVYKDVLDDKRVVAVRKLGDARHGGDKLSAEVSTIGRIYHMNLVRMWGYCSDHKHQLLVTSMWKMVSLDKHLFSSSSSSGNMPLTFLGCNERFKIAVG